jgi:Escherichia/Staphylococcus phage prohead protease
MKKKSRFRLEIKEISAEGSFQGMLSPYGNIDATGEVVEAGAFTKTLKDHGNKVPLLWQHKTDVPIGELTLEDRGEGLWCNGQLLMADAMAQRAYLFIKARIVKGLSIGFETVRDAIESGVRRLKEIRLYEGSIVTFPANESALIASVKGLKESKGDFNEELTQQQLLDAGYQMRYALGAALQSAIWAELSREEKITLSETIIQQFAEAYMAYLPNYLDMLTEMYGGMELWAAKRFETKEGRKISAATLETIKSACAQIDAGHKALLALVEEDAGGEVSETKAAPATSSDPAAAPKSEPALNHSALITKIRELKGVL